VDFPIQMVRIAVAKSHVPAVAESFHFHRKIDYGNRPRRRSLGTVPNFRFDIVQFRDGFTFFASLHMYGLGLRDLGIKSQPVAAGTLPSTRMFQ
jgi:hypothetical protein